MISTCSLPPDPHDLELLPPGRLPALAHRLGMPFPPRCASVRFSLTTTVTPPANQPLDLLRPVPSTEQHIRYASRTQHARQLRQHPGRHLHAVAPARVRQREEMRRLLERRRRTRHQSVCVTLRRHALRRHIRRVEEDHVDGAWAEHPAQIPVQRGQVGARVGGVAIPRRCRG